MAISTPCSEQSRAAFRAAALTCTGSFSQSGLGALVSNLAEKGPAFMAPMDFSRRRGRSDSENLVFCKVYWFVGHDAIAVILDVVENVVKGFSWGNRKIRRPGPSPVLWL